MPLIIIYNKVVMYYFFLKVDNSRYLVILWEQKNNIMWNQTLRLCLNGSLRKNNYFTHECRHHLFFFFCTSDIMLIEWEQFIWIVIIRLNSLEF